MPRVALILFTLCLAGGACANNDTAPSPVPSPTPSPSPAPVPTVSSLTVTSAQTGATTHQLQATARMSDGSTRDVTSAAQWDSSNPSLCAISTTGLLTAMHSGTVEVRARYENVTGSASVTLNVPIYSLNGMVSAAAPASRLFEGVKVTLTAGPNTGQFTYTDDRGLFTFSALNAGSHTLAVNHSGYQPWTQTIVLADNVTNLSIVLYPVPATTMTATGPTR